MLAKGIIRERGREREGEKGERERERERERESSSLYNSPLWIVHKKQNASGKTK